MNENILIILVLLFGGFAIRFALTLTGQNWAKTYQQTVAFLVLPFVTFVITKTISGNISLSLGMIGAMSIVRFRNPVKSALELVMYFALITLGIAANVKYQWAIALIFIIIAIIVGVKLINFLSNKFNKSFPLFYPNYILIEPKQDYLKGKLFTHRIKNIYFSG